MPVLSKRRGVVGSDGFASMMLTTTTIILALSTLATAQVGTILDASKLPQCALNCVALKTAQQACVPAGGAPQTNQATYQSCFCHSNFLVNYAAGALSPTCDAECTSASDRQKILSWYQGLCAAGAAVVTPNAQDNAAAAPTGTSTVTSGTATSTGSSSSQNGAGSKNTTPSWLDLHYRWIIMVAVLIVAGILAIILGLWLKRRHDRKWATGGFTRESMLNHSDAANALQNRHPDAPQSMSKLHVPQYDGNTYMSGGVRSKDGPPPGSSGAMAPGFRSKSVRSEVRALDADPEKDSVTGLGGRTGSKRLSKGNPKRNSKR